jgi:hypothetical protein
MKKKLLNWILRFHLGSSRKNAGQPNLVDTLEFEERIKIMAEQAVNDVAIKYRESENHALEMERHVFEVLHDHMKPLVYSLTPNQRHDLAKLVIARLKKVW